jgi:hypothetical protein
MPIRQASVNIQPTWIPREEFELNRLGRNPLEVSDPEDLRICGSLEFYDKTFDKVSTKTERPLSKTDRVFNHVTTTDDPNIRAVCISCDVLLVHFSLGFSLPRTATLVSSSPTASLPH